MGRLRSLLLASACTSARFHADSRGAWLVKRALVVHRVRIVHVNDFVCRLVELVMNVVTLVFASTKLAVASNGAGWARFRRHFFASLVGVL